MSYKPVKPAITIDGDNPKYGSLQLFLAHTAEQQQCMLKNQTVMLGFFTMAGPQIGEWLDVIEDNWMTTEGRYCSQSIVDEFKRNIAAIKCLVRGLKSPMASHNLPYRRPPAKRN